MTDVFHHPWLGGLFGDAASADIWSSDRQLSHMIAFEAAFTRALGDAGRIDPALADRVAAQIDSFRPDLAHLRNGTATDGLPVPALVRQLRKATGQDAAVHTGATSQDVIDTALALTLRDMTTLLDRRLDALQTAVATLENSFGRNHMMGRTRMQAALPIAVSDRLATWGAPLKEHRKRLAASGSRVARLQLGGAVGTNSALAPDAAQMTAHMAHALDLAAPPAPWHNTRDNIADYAGLLSLISGSIGKIGQDICLMAQNGMDDITLSGGGGSSAMPHKQNPILAELLVTLARYNATQLPAMHHALIHEQERSGAAWGLEWMILPHMAQATARSLSAAITLCGQITRIGTPSAP